MQSKYYYLTSSLPYLMFGAVPPVTVHSFMSECRKWLSARDLKIIHELPPDSFHIKSEDPEIVKNWKHFNNNLRDEIFTIRTEKKHGQQAKLSAFIPEINNIFEGENPLDVEMRFEKARWDFLDSREFMYRFDINWLAIYLLKLYILERIASFNKERGRKTFVQLSESIYA